MKRLEKFKKRYGNELGVEVGKKLFVSKKNVKWLASECGVTSQYIYSVMNGQKPPSSKVVKVLSENYGWNEQEIRQMQLNIVS